MRIFLVRHGQTELNREARFRGMSDARLNNSGIKEAVSAANIVGEEKISAIHASRVRRAVETAQIISETTGAEVFLDEGFLDVDYGGWQGLTVEEVRKTFGDEALRVWRKEPLSFVFPHGDRMRDVHERVKSAIMRLISDYPEENVCVVTHLAILKVAFISMFDLPGGWFWKLEIENGSVSSVLHLVNEGFVLETWNRSK
ncbi:MAG: histidine phosphatase family protein [Actinomycetota bacterium]|nr:histidine phosphatase family protein [Actinomycetota bacterium]